MPHPITITLLIATPYLDIVVDKAQVDRHLARQQPLQYARQPLQRPDEAMCLDGGRVGAVREWMKRCVWMGGWGGWGWGLDG